MPKKTFNQLPEEKQQQIIKAGLHLFSEHHYSVVKVSHIINASDIPRSSFYDYFTDKKDFYHFLLVTISEEKARHMAAFDVESLENVYDKMQYMFKAAAEFALKHPTYEALFNKALEEPDAMIDLYGDYYLDSSAWFEKCLLEGIEKKQVNQEINVVFIAQSLSNLTSAWLSNPHNNLDKIEEVSAQLIQFIKNGIKCSPEEG